MSIDQRIANLENELAALKAELNESAVKAPEMMTVFDGWKPGKGDNYCCVYLANPQPFTVSRNDGHNVDDLRIKRCIGLRTSAQAAAVADAIFVMLELRNQPGAGYCDDNGHEHVALMDKGGRIYFDWWGDRKSRNFICPSFASPHARELAINKVGRDRVERALRVWGMMPVEVQS